MIPAVSLSPEFPGLSASKSRDFGIRKCYKIEHNGGRFAFYELLLVTYILLLYVIQRTGKRVKTEKPFANAVSERFIWMELILNLASWHSRHG